MKRIISHLRKQPESVRRHILHVSTFAYAIILAILWAYSLGQNFKNKDSIDSIKKDLSPLSVLKYDMVGNVSASTNNVVR